MNVMNRRQFVSSMAAGAAILNQRLRSASHAGLRAPVAGRPKNVIVIMTDSMRADHLGCYGNKWIRTPRLDKLASESSLFTRAYSEGLPTIPVRTAMWTGMYTFPFRGWQPLERTDITIAEILWDKGYTSALITDTYHMHKPSFNMGRGFDYVEFIRGQEYDPWIVDESIKVDLDSYFRPRRGAQEERRQMIQYLRNRAHWRREEDHFIAQVVKAGLRWLSGLKRRERIFLWLDCFDPHEPWDPPQPYNRMYDPNYKGIEHICPTPGPTEGYLSPEEVKHVAALYAGEVTLVDKWVGFFLDGLKDLGLYDASLIIYVSDHGEPLGERGIVRKARPWPYEELGRICFMVRHPEGVGQGKRIDAFVQSCDIAPTILDYLGVKPPLPMHGTSVLGLMSGQTDKIRDFAMSCYHQQTWSIRWGDWSYYLFMRDHLREPPPLKKPELYNLKDDPLEKKNLADKEPELAKELELKMRKFASSLKWPVR